MEQRFLRYVRTYLLALRQRWLYENQIVDFKLYRLQENNDSFKTLLRWYSFEKSKLIAVDVLNDCFNIWQNGQFATINGFRVGRHPSSQVVKKNSSNRNQ